MQRWIDYTLRLSYTSSHPNHLMAAVVVRGGQVVAKATNLGTWGKHAERRAIRPHDDLTGCTVYVARSNGGCSQPCPDCHRILEEAGVSKVVFVGKSGKIEQIRFGRN